MDEKLKELLELWGQETVTSIQATLVAQRNIASRTLLDSIEYTVGDGFVQFTMAEYGHYVDVGSKPHWAPIAPFKTWARLKRLPPSAAFAVRASIAGKALGGSGKGGTKPHRFFDQVIQREIANLLPKLDKGFIDYLDGRISLLNDTQ